jgi:predicted aldo/keto reductase-like oxidoreductase
MEKIRKNFGFGCMRLPMIGEDVDIEQTKQMVDCFLEQGFNYFDTAHGYLQGKSELALKDQPLPAGGLCPDRQAERVLF